MSFDQLRGVAAAESLFNSLDDGARTELVTLLAEIGKLVLAAQQAAVPVASGDLKAGLTIEIQVALLRVKIGLVRLRRGRDPLFYGRFVDQGVKAQTVLVERRRRVNGRLRVEKRGNRKRLSDVVARYSLHVKPQPARPFIEPAGADLDSQIDGLIQDFWVRVLSRAGATG